MLPFKRIVLTTLTLVALLPVLSSPALSQEEDTGRVRIEMGDPYGFSLRGSTDLNAE